MMSEKTLHTIYGSENFHHANLIENRKIVLSNKASFQHYIDHVQFEACTPFLGFIIRG